MPSGTGGSKATMVALKLQFWLTHQGAGRVTLRTAQMTGLGRVFHILNKVDGGGGGTTNIIIFLNLMLQSLN